MNALVTIMHLTLHEAARRRILVATLIGAGAFLILFGVGFHFVALNVEHDKGMDFLRRRMALNFLTLAGLYATHFLTLMTAVLLPVDTLSGEIASGVVQTVASKPVNRSSIVLGKWLAFSLVAVAYFALVSSGVLGARLATVTNGILVFGLYGIAFIGGWVEQVGAMLGNLAAENVGTVASLVMPTEALWHRAAYYMQPSVMRDLQMTPFSPASLPSVAMVWYAALYAALALLAGVQGFRKRAL